MTLGCSNILSVSKELCQIQGALRKMTDCTTLAAVDKDLNQSVCSVSLTVPVIGLVSSLPDSSASPSPSLSSASIKLLLVLALFL